ASPRPRAAHRLPSRASARSAVRTGVAWPPRYPTRWNGRLSCPRDHGEETSKGGCHACQDRKAAQVHGRRARAQARGQEDPDGHVREGAREDGEQEEEELSSIDMATEKQRAAARENIKKASAAAKEKRTIAHLPKSTRTALGKQGAKSRKD